MSISTTSIQVALRIRSVNDQYRNQPHCATLNDNDCLSLTGNTIRVVPHNKVFAFDHVFGPTTTQNDLFSALGVNLVDKFVEGHNVTVLAYGQTSSGKTYTMGTAPPYGHFSKTDEGIVPRAIVYLFDTLEQQSSSSQEQSGSLRSSASSSTTGSPLSKYTVKVSFIEIHNEQLIDLLSEAPTSERPQISIREDTKGQIHWTGVKELDVHNSNDVLYHLEQGTKHRATGATSMNDKSSRSHAIFSVTLQQSSSTKNAVPDQAEPSSSRTITTSKFHFVDLAGSERLKRTATEGNRRKEGININAGLHALGNVLSALGDESRRDKHVPYRDSKLTRLLRDSLGGSATTLMIACANPLELNVVETLNTLQFANRARNIKIRLERNQEWETTDNVVFLRSLVRKLRHQIKYLKSTAANGIISLDGVDNVSHLQLTGNGQEGVGDKTLVIESIPKLDQREHTTLDVDYKSLATIEEYDQIIAKLESELDEYKTAQNRQTLELETLQSNYSDLQHSFEYQGSTMAQLHTRLNKTVDRELNNIGYIDQLETKLKQVNNELTRDKTLLDEQRIRIAKLKENEKTTELYIQDLEQQLATNEENLQRLSNSMELLKRQSYEKDDTIMDLHRQLHAAYENGFTQQRSLLAQMDNLGEKFLELERDRDGWKKQAQQSFDSIETPLKVNGRNGSASLSPVTDQCITTTAPCHHSANDELLEKYLKELGNKHKDAITELDSVLQHYGEALEELEELEDTSVKESTQPPLSPCAYSDDDWDDHQSGMKTPTDPRGGYLDHEIDRALHREDRCKIASLEIQVKLIQEKMDPTHLQLDALMNWKEDFVERNRAAMDKLEKEHQATVDSLEALKRNDVGMDQKQLETETSAAVSMYLKSLYHRTLEDLEDCNLHPGDRQRMTNLLQQQPETSHDLTCIQNEKNKPKPLASIQEALDKMGNTHHQHHLPAKNVIGQILTSAHHRNREDPTSSRSKYVTQDALTPTCTEASTLPPFSPTNDFNYSELGRFYLQDKGIHQGGRTMMVNKEQILKQELYMLARHMDTLAKELKVKDKTIKQQATRIQQLES